MLDQQSRILGTVGSEDGNDSRNLGRMGRLRTLRNATAVWWPISALLESASYTFYNGYINRSSNPCRGATSVGYQPAPLFSLTASLPAVRVIPNTSQVFGTVVFSSLKTRLPGSNTDPQGSRWRPNVLPRLPNVWCKISGRPRSDPRFHPAYRTCRRCGSARWTSAAS